MTIVTRRTFRVGVVTAFFAMSWVAIVAGPASALEVSEPVSTFGNDISLTDFRGKKWVLIEFYGADFSPS